MMWNDKVHRCYLYRAINQYGETVDFYLSTKRDTQATKTLLKKVFKPCKLERDYPRVVITDKAGAYQHRTSKYLNNRIEADHGKLKRVLQLVRGFKSFLMASRTLKGVELMRMFRKGQCKPFQYKEGIAGEIHLIERQFVF